MSKGNSILGIYLGFTDKIGRLRNWGEVKGKRTANHFLESQVLTIKTIESLVSEFLFVI